MKITPIKKLQQTAKVVPVKEFNKLIDRVNNLADMRGRNGVSVNVTPFGVNIRGTKTTVGGGGGNAIRFAITKESASESASISILCNLLNDNDVEITSGDESEVQVYCWTTGGNALNKAFPSLTTDDILLVTQMPHFDVDEDKMIQRWYALGSPFGLMEIC